MDELIRVAAFAIALLQTPAAPEPTLDAPPIKPPIIQEPDRWFGNDKARHFWMSYATTAFTYAAARAAEQNHDISLSIGIGSGVIAGIGKELHDRRRGERFSARDLVADALGIAAAYFLLREVR